MSPNKNQSPSDDPLEALERALEKAEREIELYRKASMNAELYRQAIAILKGGQVPVPRKAKGESHAHPRVRLVGKTLPVFTGDETQVQAAEKVLEAAGHPLRLRALCESMVAAGYKTQNWKKIKTGITKSLDRLVRERVTFYKSAPGTYGLLKWEQPSLLVENNG